MRNRCISLFLLFLPRMIAIQVGSIPNATLIASGTIVNGTCDECICTMLTSKQNVRSFNCFPSNNTCELFGNYSSSFIYTIQNQSNNIFYFLQLPSVTTVTDNPVTTTSTDVHVSLILTSASK
jgi:hypothetical protein